MSYDKLNLEKGMYASSTKSFSDILEELDPSDQYIGTPLENLDAFERQLKRYNIVLKGPHSDKIEKFFNTSNSSVLFPEYISRAVRLGMEQVNVLPNIVASTTTINGLDYRPVASNPSKDEKNLKPVMEGTSLPQTEVKVQSNLIKLNKRGRMLVASYEALKFQKLDLFTITLKQIGAYISRALTDDAINVLINGDGNNNPIPAVSQSPSQLSYTELLKIWSTLSPYQLNTLIANTETTQAILALTEMKDAVAGLNFQGTGNMITPMGANLIHVSSVPSKTILGIDKNYALEMVQAGEIVTEFDKLIDRQLERASISCIAGFAKIFNDAGAKLVVQ